MDIYAEYRPAAAAYVAEHDAPGAHGEALLHAWLVDYLVFGGDDLDAAYAAWLDLQARKRKNVTKVPSAPSPKTLPAAPRPPVLLQSVTKRKPAAAVCLECGQAVERPETGRPPKFCSNKCKMRAYRRRKREGK